MTCSRRMRCAVRRRRGGQRRPDRLDVDASQQLADVEALADARAVGGDAPRRRSPPRAASSGRSSASSSTGGSATSSSPRSCRSRLWRLSSLLLGPSSSNRRRGRPWAAMLARGRGGRRRPAARAAARMPRSQPPDPCSNDPTMPPTPSPPTVPTCSPSSNSRSARRSRSAPRRRRPPSAWTWACRCRCACGEVETIEYQRDRGMAVTVYFGTRKGSASTADLSAGALRETVAKACSIARFTAEDPVRGHRRCRTRWRRDIPDLDLAHPWDVTPERACELALECEAAAMAVDRAHHQFRGRGRQHASRRARLRQLARLPRCLSRHRAQPELRGARRRGRGDGARLLVLDRARLARTRGRGSRSAARPASARCAASARGSSAR